MSDITINVKNDGMLGRIGTEGLGQKLIEMSKIADKQQDEIERLNNIIKELEKWLYGKIEEYRNTDSVWSYVAVRNKLGELKENK